MNVYAEVRERDGRCRVCGSAGTEVHHIRFRSQGGPDEPWNLIFLCKGCHGRAHGLSGTRIFAWELHALAMFPDSYQPVMACLTCKYRSYDGCEIWEHPVEWDYGCDAWRLRTDK